MENKIDFLVEILSVQTKSRQEKKMKKYIKAYIRSLGLTYSHDNKGNIYCNKGDMRKSRPFVVAHMDTVHEMSSNIKVFNSDGMLFAFDTKEGSQRGIGGDDKVGVWAALCALTDWNDVSVAFFVEEEIGRIGSRNAEMSRFKKANWIAQLDRKGYEDFIVSDMTSKEFDTAVKDTVESHGLKFTKQDTITDVSELASRGVGVSCVNISSGYYSPHTRSEIVKVDDALNSLNLLYSMISKFGDVRFKHEIPKPKQRKPYVYEPKGITTRASVSIGDCYKVYDSMTNSYTVYVKIGRAHV